MEHLSAAGSVLAAHAAQMNSEDKRRGGRPKRDPSTSEEASAARALACSSTLRREADAVQAALQALASSTTQGHDGGEPAAGVQRNAERTSREMLSAFALAALPAQAELDRARSSWPALAASAASTVDASSIVRAKPPAASRAAPAAASTAAAAPVATAPAAAATPSAHGKEKPVPSPPVCIAAAVPRVLLAAARGTEGGSAGSSSTAPQSSSSTAPQSSRSTAPQSSGTRSPPKASPGQASLPEPARQPLQTSSDRRRQAAAPSASVQQPPPVPRPIPVSSPTSAGVGRHAFASSPKEGGTAQGPPAADSKQQAAPAPVAPLHPSERAPAFVPSPAAFARPEQPVAGIPNHPTPLGALQAAFHSAQRTNPPAVQGIPRANLLPMPGERGAPLTVLAPTASASGASGLRSSQAGSPAVALASGASGLRTSQAGSPAEALASGASGLRTSQAGSPAGPRPTNTATSVLLPPSLPSPQLLLGVFSAQSDGNIRTLAPTPSYQPMRGIPGLIVPVASSRTAGSPAVTLPLPRQVEEGTQSTAGGISGTPGGPLLLQPEETDRGAPSPHSAGSSDDRGDMKEKLRFFRSILEGERAVRSALEQQIQGEREVRVALELQLREERAARELQVRAEEAVRGALEQQLLREAAVQAALRNQLQAERAARADPELLQLLREADQPPEAQQGVPDPVTDNAISECSVCLGAASVTCCIPCSHVCMVGLEIEGWLWLGRGGMAM